jgi:hypothetical protein
MPLFVEMEVRVGWTPNSNPAFLGQFQANVPGQGLPSVAAVASGQYGVAPPMGTNPRTIFNSQVVQYITGEPVPVAAGSEVSVTVANILTALSNCIQDIAGATTPMINSAAITQIQNWAIGNP